QRMQSRMDIGAVRADVNAAHLAFEQIHVRRKDDDFGLLQIGLDIVHELERAEDIPQCDATDELDLSGEVAAGSDVLGEASAVAQEEVGQRLLGAPLKEQSTQE